MSQQGIKEESGIELGDDIWLGANVTVLFEVTIGDSSIVGAGAEITSAIPINWQGLMYSMKIVFLSVANVPSKIAESVFTMKLSEALVENGHDVLLLAHGIAPADGDLAAAHDYYGVPQTYQIRRLPALVAFPRRRFVTGAVGACWAGRWGASIAYGRNIYAC